MNVLENLATSLNRRDEVPNTELAVKISKKNDTSAVKVLVENLYQKNKNIAHDCIKVLYEIGERKPALIEPYIKEFISLLESKNNRMQWGAMHALDAITGENKKSIYSVLAKIIDAADKGTVITRDHAVAILIKLCSDGKYAGNAFKLLIEQLKKCPTNQLPMYAENSMSIITERNKSLFIKTLENRFDELEKDSQRKRLEKVFKKITSSR